MKLDIGLAEVKHPLPVASLNRPEDLEDHLHVLPRTHEGAPFVDECRV